MTRNQRISAAKRFGPVDVLRVKLPKNKPNLSPFFAWTASDKLKEDLRKSWNNFHKNHTELKTH